MATSDFGDRVAWHPSDKSRKNEREGKDGLDKLGDISVALLSGEVSCSMSGVYIGLYASGNGSASAVPADFACFK